MTPKLRTPVPSLPDRFRDAEPIGEGSFAVVWRAVDGRDGATVAVKVIRPELLAMPEMADRLKREFQVCRGLDHRNVVRVRDAWLGPDGAGLVLDYLPAPTLTRILHEGGRLAPARAEALARDLLAGLGYLHERGLVHRDVKPDNVLMAEDGRAVLTDLGLVLPLNLTRVTATGAVVGTLLYMAPELLHGRRATPAADLFSAGAVLWEALTGVEPARRLTGAFEPLPPPSKLVSDVPPALERVVVNLLAVDPERRPASASAALALLASDDSAVSEAPVRVAARSRPRTASIAAAVAGLALVGALALRGPSEPEQPEARPPTTAAVAAPSPEARVARAVAGLQRRRLLERLLDEAAAAPGAAGPVVAEVAAAALEVRPLLLAAAAAPPVDGLEAELARFAARAHLFTLDALLVRAGRPRAFGWVPGRGEVVRVAALGRTPPLLAGPPPRGVFARVFRAEEKYLLASTAASVAVSASRDVEFTLEPGWRAACADGRATLVVLIKHEPPGKVALVDVNGRLTVPLWHAGRREDDDYGVELPCRLFSEGRNVVRLGLLSTSTFAGLTPALVKRLVVAPGGLVTWAAGDLRELDYGPGPGGS